MDDTFHETQSFFINPQLHGKSILEAESILGSLSLLMSKTPIMKTHKKIAKGEDHNEAEKEDLEIKYQRRYKLTLLPQQIEMS
ncbi:hypothetical protein CR513_00191, partial [Mucuna pruriens]